MSVITFSLLLLFLIMLLFPITALSAASEALLIWYQKLVPSLLPYLLMTRILIRCRAADKLPPPVITMLIGFTGGFPMGAVLVNEQLNRHLIKEKDGQILLNYCNLPSPSFLVNYAAAGCLGLRPPQLILLCVYLPSVLMLLCYYLQPAAKHALFERTDSAAAFRGLSFHELENIFTDSALTMVRIGFYLMIFSLLAGYIKQLSFFPDLLSGLLIGFFEITAGMKEIGSLSFNYPLKQCLGIFLCSFGGCSFLAQTGSYIKDTRLSLRSYALSRLFCAGTSAALAALCLYFL